MAAAGRPARLIAREPDRAHVTVQQRWPSDGRNFDPCRARPGLTIHSHRQSPVGSARRGSPPRTGRERRSRRARLPGRSSRHIIPVGRLRPVAAQLQMSPGSRYGPLSARPAHGPPHAPIGARWVSISVVTCSAGTGWSSRSPTTCSPSPPAATPPTTRTHDRWGRILPAGSAEDLPKGRRSCSMTSSLKRLKGQRPTFVRAGTRCVASWCSNAAHRWTRSNRRTIRSWSKSRSRTAHGGPAGSRRAEPYAAVRLRRSQRRRHVPRPVGSHRDAVLLRRPALNAHDRR